jgi:hypothetical protein
VDTAEDIAAEKQRLEKDYVGISVESPACGRSLAAAVHGADASALHVFGEPPAEVETAFASLVDYLRDYGDCADLYSEVQRVDVFRDLDKLLAQLAARRFTVAVGHQEAVLATPSASSPSVPWRVVYFACHPVGRPMTTMFVPRRVSL